MLTLCYTQEKNRNDICILYNHADEEFDNGTKDIDENRQMCNVQSGFCVNVQVYASCRMELFQLYVFRKCYLSMQLYTVHLFHSLVKCYNIRLTLGDYFSTCPVIIFALIIKTKSLACVV